VVSAARGDGRTLDQGPRHFGESLFHPDRRRRAVSGEKSTLSGAKGFAIILGSMFGIIALLWVLAALVAP
jgi:hypothetical protein